MAANVLAELATAQNELVSLANGALPIVMLIAVAGLGVRVAPKAIGWLRSAFGR